MDQHTNQNDINTTPITYFSALVCIAYRNGSIGLYIRIDKHYGGIPIDSESFAWKLPQQINIKPYDIEKIYIAAIISRIPQNIPGEIQMHSEKDTTLKYENIQSIIITNTQKEKTPGINIGIKNSIHACEQKEANWNNIIPNQKIKNWAIY